MADGGRTCTECPQPVSGRALTCSDRCRKRRSERLRAARANGGPQHSIARSDVEAAADAVLRSELTPVVREALTEDVLDGIRRLVEHVPAAVARLVEDLDSTDGNIRQRAYMELLKRTVGNQQIVPDVNAEANRNLEVYFNLPRPDQLQGLPEAEVIESKQCDSCGSMKPLGEFVGTSDRCRECFKEMQETAKRFASDRPV